MNDILLEQYKDYVQGKYHKKNTIDTYIENPARMLRHINKPTSELTQQDVNDYCIHCQQTKKINGNAIRFYAIRQYLMWAGHKDLILPRVLPVDSGKQALDEESSEKLLETVEHMSALHRLVFYLENDTLRRPSEIRGIKLNDRYGEILTYTGKTRSTQGRQRCVMTERLLQAWDDYLQVRPVPRDEDKDYLIISDYGRYKGRRLTQNGLFTRIIREIAMTARVEIPFGEKPTNYLIKRTGITRQLKQCLDPKIIQLQAGHTNLATTMKYNRVSEQDIKDYLALYEHNNTKNKRKRGLGEDIRILPLKKSPGTYTRKESEDGDTNSVSFSVTFSLIDIRGGGLTSFSHLCDSSASVLPYQGVLW